VVETLRFQKIIIANHGVASPGAQELSGDKLLKVKK
jgi:hypothetical protein